MPYNLWICTPFKRLKTKTMTIIPDEEVIVKISVCQKCNGAIRTAIKHLMDDESGKSFMEEVMQYNLSVKEQHLLKYRKEKTIWCNCNK